jgi:hypothetical protein
MHGTSKNTLGGVGQVINYDTALTDRNGHLFELRNYNKGGSDIHGYQFKTRRMTTGAFFDQTKTVDSSHKVKKSPTVEMNKIELSPLMMNPDLGASNQDLRILNKYKGVKILTAEDKKLLQ